MANLDTPSKRASSLGWGLHSNAIMPFPPDGTLAQGDRQHIAVSYSGVLAEEFTPPVATDVDETDASHFLRRPASTMHRTHSAHNAGSHYGISALPFWQWRPA